MLIGLFNKLLVFASQRAVHDVWNEMAQSWLCVKKEAFCVEKCQSFMVAPAAEPALCPGKQCQ